jgi:hypothetical protein
MEGLDKIASRKANLVVELLRVSTLLRKAIENDDMEMADRCMGDRSRFFQEIEGLDRLIGKQPTSRDADILAMLKKLQKMDEDLFALGMKGREIIFKEVAHLSQMRIDLLDQELIEPKGQSLNVRG